MPCLITNSAAATFLSFGVVTRDKQVRDTTQDTTQDYTQTTI